MSVCPTTRGPRGYRPSLQQSRAALPPQIVRVLIDLLERPRHPTDLAAHQFRRVAVSSQYGNRPPVMDVPATFAGLGAEDERLGLQLLAVRSRLADARRRPLACW